MPMYLISFPSAAMVVAHEELPAVSVASRAVVEEARAAGVWGFGGGIDGSVPPGRVGGGGAGVPRAYEQAGPIEGGQAVGKHVMVAGIEAGNRGSIALHEELGFEQVGLLPQVGMKFGRWLDLAFLQLVLDDRATPQG